MNRLENQVAVVTGGGRGFGRAIAQGLAGEGASVVVTARTQAELDGTVELIRQAGGRAHAVTGDVTNRDDVARVREETEAQFGPATIVVNNAGVPWPFGPTWYVDPDRWWDAQAIHVRGAMLYINAFVPSMIERKHGHFIIVASRAGRAIRPNLSGYGVAKATQIRLAGFLAEEGRPHNVYAYSIQPGNVLTELSNLTMGDPDARKYVSDFVENLDTRKDAQEDGSAGLKRCAEVCISLASGRYDALSGQYIQPEDDLDALLKAAAAGQLSPV